MLQNHFVLMLLYAAFVAVIGGVLVKETRPGLLRAAGAIFGGLVGSAFVASWLLYFLPL